MGPEKENSPESSDGLGHGPVPLPFLTGTQGHQHLPSLSQGTACPMSVPLVGGEHLVPAVFPWFPHKIKITLKAAWHLPASLLGWGLRAWRTQPAPQLVPWKPGTLDAQGISWIHLTLVHTGQQGLGKLQGQSYTPRGKGPQGRLRAA